MIRSTLLRLLHSFTCDGGVARKPLVKGRLSLAAALMLLVISSGALRAGDDAAERWSIDLSSPESLLLMTPPCPVFQLASRSTGSIGVGFVELVFRDLRGHDMKKEDVFEVLMHSRWSVQAS